ncbi:MAG: sigma-70 family RNA polymerase sigma factor [Acidobacteriota bacterium]
MTDSSGRTPGSQAAVGESIDHLFRHQAGEMVAVLTRIFGLRHLDLVEDMVQEALLQALRLWPFRGMPDNPSAWIIQVAKNRALEVLRRRGRWREEGPRIEALLTRLPDDGESPPPAFAREVRDDQLRMILACCHPLLKRDDQVALTLKTVGGFSVGEIARALLTRRATIAQRLVRAKRRLRDAGVELAMPESADLIARLEVVHEIVYLMFNEGWDAAEGESLVRRDLLAEGLRLSALLAAHPLTSLPSTYALAALLRFQAARLSTRVDGAGDLLLMADQNRSCWDRSLIAEALDYLLRAARGSELTPYHYQAEIAACHATAETYDSTDWGRILSCYDGLMRSAPSPVVALNRLVALAQAKTPQEALEQGTEVFSDAALATYLPAWATRGDLAARCGLRDEAETAFRQALALSPSPAVRRHLEKRIARLRASAESTDSVSGSG